MTNTAVLPEGYTEFFNLDLQKNKKTALLVNGLALVIAVLMFAIAVCFVPIRNLFDLDSGFFLYFAKFFVMFAGIIGYMILHELIHGVCMKHFVKLKVHYGFTGLYAYAGSDGYFNKKSYLIIALAPVVVWGIVLLGLNFLVNPGWFWVVYFIQICNISGAAGDIYVTCKFTKMPSDILVHDSGVAMTVYAPSR